MASTASSVLVEETASGWLFPGDADMSRAHSPSMRGNEPSDWICVHSWDDSMSWAFMMCFRGLCEQSYRDRMNEFSCVPQQVPYEPEYT